MPASSIFRLCLSIMAGFLMLGPTATLAEDPGVTWSVPTAAHQHAIRIPRSSGGDAATTFLVEPSTPVTSPADGTLIYNGPLNAFEVGFIISHKDSMYSVISSPYSWESSNIALLIGTTIRKGQHLATARASASDSQIPINWKVFKDIENRLSGVNDLVKFVGSPQAKQLGLENKNDVLKIIFTSTLVDTKQLMTLAPVQLNYGEGVSSKTNFSINLDNREIPHIDVIFNAFLLKAGAHEIEITSGRIFKTKKKSTIFLTVGGTSIQSIQVDKSGDVVLGMAEFLPNTHPSVSQAEASVLPLSIASNAPENLGKESEQASKKQDENEQARQVQEAHAKEQSRLAEVARLQEQERLAQEEAAKRQDQLAREKLANEQARLVQEARAKEQSRLAEVARLQEQERLVQVEVERKKILSTSLLRDAEVMRLRQQLATLEDEKALRDQKPIFAMRRALVIGNDSYKQVVSLANAREDAKAIAESLRQVGYEVTLKLDSNEKEMKAALRAFKGQVQGGDEVLFFFAGHGIQLGSANYLLPIDINSDSAEQIKDDAIQLQRVLDDMSERKVKFTLAMIDACRDSPFKSFTRDIGGRGLAPTTAATGQMVIFSAGVGQQALDKLGPNDRSKNGLFTRVFIKEMQKPGVSIDKVVRNVRNEVFGMAMAIGHEQVPAIYDQVVGEFYFRR